MKILLICHEYPPLGGGGGRQLANLARMYAKDHAVYFLTVGFQQSGICQCEGYTLHRLPAQRKSQVKPSNAEFFSFLYEAWKAIPQIVETFRPEIVQVFFSIPEGLLLFHPTLRRLPGIISVRGADVPGHDPNRFPILYKIVHPIVKKIWAHAQRVVCNSDDLRREVLAISPGLPVDVIPNGIDCERFRPIRDHNPPMPLTLLYVGRLIPLKQIDLVVKTIALLCGQGKQVKFRIVGTGEQEHALHQLVASLQLQEHILFDGAMAYQQIHTVYQQADLYIQLSRVEGMSNAILEAMASGLPIITTNVGGASTLMQNNGIIVYRPSVESVATSINEYFNNPSRLITEGKRSRKLAKHYGFQPISTQYLKLFSKSIATKHSESGNL